MKQLQVIVPENRSEKVEKILEDYSSDISSSRVEKKKKHAMRFDLTVESGQIDKLTKELKGVKELEQGQLSIRVIDQDSLIEKGQETKGSSSDLSQQQIYSQAQEFSGFDHAEWGLSIVSGLVAAIGLSMGNLIVVIGAMMFAPLLSPLVAASTAMTVGDSDLMKHSLRTTGESVVLTVISAMAAGLVLESSAQILPMFTEPSVINVALAVLVGSAASLSSATGRSDQVVGVAVAIALVPPLAAAGLEIASGNIFNSSMALLIASINIVGVLIGGTITFRILGLEPETYYKEIEAKKMQKFLPITVGLMILAAFFIWLI